jgi:hypothetical protein
MEVMLLISTIHQTNFRQNTLAFSLLYFHVKGGVEVEYNAIVRAPARAEVWQEGWACGWPSGIFLSLLVG